MGVTLSSDDNSHAERQHTSSVLALPPTGFHIDAQLKRSYSHETTMISPSISSDTSTYIDSARSSTSSTRSLHSTRSYSSDRMVLDSLSIRHEESIYEPIKYHLKEGDALYSKIVMQLEAIRQRLASRDTRLEVEAMRCLDTANALRDPREQSYLAEYAYLNEQRIEVKQLIDALIEIDNAVTAQYRTQNTTLELIYQITEHIFRFYEDIETERADDFLWNLSMVMFPNEHSHRPNPHGTLSVDDRLRQLVYQKIDNTIARDGSLTSRLQTKKRRKDRNQMDSIFRDVSGGDVDDTMERASMSRSTPIPIVNNNNHTLKDNSSLHTSTPSLNHLNSSPAFIMLSSSTKFNIYESPQ